MIQKPSDIEWLVSVPEGKTFTVALKAACRGNDKLANLLNYFLYEAACEAKRQGIDKDTAKYIEIKRKPDAILKALSKHNKSASRKTIHDRIVDLTFKKAEEEGEKDGLGYLEADGYHQTYRVFFKNIEKALANPPEAEKPRLRGRHANKQASQDNSEQSKDGNFESKVKSSISTPEIEDLRQEMSSLTFQMSNLTFQMSNLTSELAHERACREELEAKIASLYITNTLLNTERENTAPKEETSTQVPLSEQQPLLDAPLVEPSMNGKWDAEKVVQYTEFRNGKRYNLKMREAQLSAAKWLHTQDKALTSEQYKQAFDERFDPWWVEHKKKLDVTDMKAKEQSSGVIRLYAMLSKIEANKNRPNLRVVSSQPKPVDMPPPPKTREQLRAEKC